MEKNKHYLWWVPCTAIYFSGYAYLSKMNNEYGGDWFLYLFLYGLISIWVFVSRVSENLLFDGMLFTNISFVTYVATMLFVGEASTFHTIHWIGLLLIIIGSVLMRMEKENE
jgi:hypothetical protein